MLWPLSLVLTELILIATDPGYDVLTVQNSKPLGFPIGVDLRTMKSATTNESKRGRPHERFSQAVR